MFDEKGYRSFLFFLLERLDAEYRDQALHVRRHQFAILRTYFWLSVLIAGAESSRLVQIGWSAHAFWLGLSLLFTLLAFLAALYAMRGRGERSLPYEMAHQMIADAYHAADRGHIEPVLVRLTQHLQEEVRLNARENHRRGLWLRRIQTLLLLSCLAFGVSLLAGFAP